jgi:hypothetical protein
MEAPEGHQHLYRLPCFHNLEGGGAVPSASLRGLSPREAKLQDDKSERVKRTQTPSLAEAHSSEAMLFTRTGRPRSPGRSPGFHSLAAVAFGDSSIIFFGLPGIYPARRRKKRGIAPGHAGLFSVVASGDWSSLASSQRQHFNRTLMLAFPRTTIYSLDG